MNLIRSPIPRCSVPSPPQAELMRDCITQVTGHRPNFYLELPGTRAVQIFDSGLTNDFLILFGRTRSETPCTCNIKNTPTLTQALHLISGDTVSTTLSRLPTAAEKTAFSELSKTHLGGSAAAF